jgi:hypothetical protein
MRTEVELGEIDLPDGTLVILDPGLARYWRHDKEPSSPRKSDPSEFDLAIVGDDAERAGREYNREFDPVHLYDRRDPTDSKQHFDGWAKEKGYQASAEILEERLPHIERAKLAIAAGKGLGVVKYNGLWGVVAGDLPKTLRVVGTPLAEGDFQGRWEFIDVILDEDAEVASSEKVKGVMVDHGQLLFRGLSALGQFRMWESLDGLADFVFWGSDAASLAEEMGATKYRGDEYGWKDTPLDEIGDKAQAVQKRIKDEDLKVAVDYRPHCNLERLNAVMRGSDEDVAQIAIDGKRIVGCGNRWGDGVFSVSRLADAGGKTVRIRVNLGTEERQNTMRQVQMRAQGAIVTRAVIDEDKPVQFAERMKQSNPQDSGWFLSAGTENDDYMADSTNLVVVQVATLVEKFPGLAEILAAPEGAKFVRQGERFVAE